jgi:hypothetical protein
VRQRLKPAATPTLSDGLGHGLPITGAEANGTHRRMTGRSPGACLAP